MKLFKFDDAISSLYLSLVLVASPAHAEIYKWVDENGKTHYSEKKENAGKAKAEELKIKPPTASTQSSNASPEYWQEQDRLIKQRQAQRQIEPAVTKPKSLSGGRSDASDESRCNLARDITNGTVKHTNGKPIDRYDRQIAEKDIRNFCR